MAGGRPTKYDRKFVSQARKISELGGTEADVASILEVDQSTVTRWKVKYKDFAHALKVGGEPADERVKQSLYRKAIGYSFEAVKIFLPPAAPGQTPVPVVVPYIEHVPPSDTACIFWLKNRKRDDWRDRPSDEDKDGPSITVVIERLTDGPAI